MGDVGVSPRRAQQDAMPRRFAQRENAQTPARARSPESPGLCERFGLTFPNPRA